MNWENEMTSRMDLTVMHTLLFWQLDVSFLSVSPLNDIIKQHRDVQIIIQTTAAP